MALPETPKYLKIADGRLVLDKAQLQADKVTDYFTLPEAELAAIIQYYKATVEAVNAGNSTVVLTCEVSDFAARAAALAAQ